MSRLVAMREGRVVRIVRLEGPEMTIGRAPGNGVVLDHPSVSRVHARVVEEPDGWLLVDEGSTNGLEIDGRREKSGMMRDGTLAQVGVFALQVLPPEAAAASSASSAVGSAPQRALEALFLLSSEFSSLLSVGDLLEKMIDCLLGIFRAERGFILLHHPRTGKLETAIARKMERTDLSDTVSMTVAMHAATERKPVLLDDLTASDLFRDARSLERERIRSILAAPLLGDGKLQGVVYLDSQLKSRKFGAEDLEILETFCRQAGAAVASATERDELRRDLFRLKILESEREAVEFEADRIVGGSPAMVELQRQVEALAAEEVTTLLLGESGTGKELAARAIHRRSARRDRPFVAVNCMALSPTLVESELFGHEKGAFSGAGERRVGRFELADGGTLFLDEIGELSPDIQVKLLRVLQEHQIERVGSGRPLEVDVRIVAATNADLTRLMASGRFREDLYYRLNVFTLRLPPLRERREDIPALADHFVRHFESRRRKGIVAVADDALDALVHYDWPGNIRELRNVIERAFVLERADRVTRASLPAELTYFRPAPGRTGERVPAQAGGITIGDRILSRARDAFERAFIQQALARHELNVTAAAGELGMPRKSLYRKLEAFGIDLGRLQADREKEDRDQILAALRRNGGNVTAAAADLAMPRASLYRRMEAYGIDPRKCS